MLARRIAALSFGLAVLASARSAAAQSSLAQRMATAHSVMAKPHIAATRHTATELLTRYRSTAVGASALAAAHKIALSGTTAGAAAAGKTAAGTGSGVNQTSQPGGSSATTSGASNSSSAALDITIDPTQSLSGSATAGGTTMQAALYFFGANGGSVFVGQTLAGPSYEFDAGGGALLSTSTLSPGWYIVTFDLYDWTHTESGSLSQIAWGSGASPTVAADCSASTLAQTDSRGVSTCMALVQVTQSFSYNFTFVLNSGSASVIDAAISRVSP